LETTRNAITGVAPTAGVTICNKYSAALKLSNFDLVKSVVGGTVQGLTQNSITLPYFNGQFPSGSRNFLDAANSQALADLSAHLIQFFGAALGCTDGTITPYTGADMKTVHAPIRVTPEAFDAFNSILLGVLTNSGVESADVNAVSGVLESTRGDIIPQYSSDSFKPNYPSAGKVAGIIIGSIIVAALVAAACVGFAYVEKSLPKFH